MQQLVALALALLVSIPAMSMELERREISVGQRPVVMLNLVGKIEKGDASRVAEALLSPQANNTYVMSLNSEGGDVDEGLAIANLVSAHNLWTMIWTAHQCNSSCFFVFAAGARKTVSQQAFIAVHRADSDGQENQSATDATSRLLQFAAKVGVPESVLQKISSTPPSALTRLDAADMQAIGAEVLPTKPTDATPIGLPPT